MTQHVLKVFSVAHTMQRGMGMNLPLENPHPHRASRPHQVINYREIEKQRQQKRPYSIQPNWIILKFLIQLFGKNLSWEVEDNTLIGSTSSKQEVQSTRTLIFKM